MKSLVVFLVVVLVVLVLRHIRGWFTSRVEQPQLVIEKEYDSFVVVSMPPVIVATITAQGGLREASSRAFRELAGYIFGDNASVNTIAMTAPVLSKKSTSEPIAMTAPVLSQQSNDGEYLVSFTMPSQWTMETLPVPNNKRITITEQPSTRKAIWRFGGYAQDSRVNKQWEKFQVQLREASIQWSGTFTLAQYNDPFTPPWMRKNELRVDLVEE